MKETWLLNMKHVPHLTSKTWGKSDVTIKSILNKIIYVIWNISFKKTYCFFASVNLIIHWIYSSSSRDVEYQKFSSKALNWGRYAPSFYTSLLLMQYNFFHVRSLKQKILWQWGDRNQIKACISRLLWTYGDAIILLD